MPQTPNDFLNAEMINSKNALKQSLVLQIQEIERRRASMTPEQFQQVMGTLRANTLKSILSIRQKHSERQAEFDNIDKLQKQGVIEDADKAKWKMLLPPQVAEQVGVEPKKEPTVQQRITSLHSYTQNLESELKDFVYMPGESATGIADFWPLGKKAQPAELKYADPALSFVDKNGNIVQGELVSATPEQIKRYGVLQRELKRVNLIKTTLMSPPDIASRIQRVAKGESPGDLGDKISASIDLMPKQVKPVETPRQEKTSTNNKAIKVGDTVSQGGKKYKVTGFDTDGTPMGEEL